VAAGRGGLSTLAGMVALLSSSHRNAAGNACLCIGAMSSTALAGILPRPRPELIYIYA